MTTLYAKCKGCGKRFKIQDWKVGDEREFCFTCKTRPKKLELINEIVVDLLNAYSSWLEKHGYMDCDWYCEEPHAVDAFLSEYNVKK